MTAAENAGAYAGYTDGLTLDARIAAVVRAFPVPALTGLAFTCVPGQFHGALDAQLSIALPGTSWLTGTMAWSGGLVEKAGCSTGGTPHSWPCNRAADGAVDSPGDARSPGAGAAAARGRRRWSCPGGTG